MLYYFSGSSIKSQGHMGWRIDDLNPIWVRLQGQSQHVSPHLPVLASGSRYLDVISRATEMYIDGKVQGCSNSIANPLDLLQSCIKQRYVFKDILHVIRSSGQNYLLLFERRRITCKPPTFPITADSLLLAIYSISQEICTRFCCALLCCGYVIVHNEFKWSIYPY